MQPVKEYITAVPPDSLFFEVFPKGHSQVELYEDDGLSLNYQKGMYTIMKIECTEDNESIRLRFHPADGPYPAMHTNYQIKIHMGKKPKVVSARYKMADVILKTMEDDASYRSAEDCWVYDAQGCVLWISCKPDWMTGFSLEIQR